MIVSGTKTLVNYKMDIAVKNNSGAWLVLTVDVLCVVSNENQ